jgi:hypothetical protein
MPLSSGLLGLAIAACSVLLFAVLLPKGGTRSPFLRNEGMEAVLMMTLALMVFLGASLAIFGYPAGIALAK